LFVRIPASEERLVNASRDAAGRLVVTGANTFIRALLGMAVLGIAVVCIGLSLPDHDVPLNAPE